MLIYLSEIFYFGTINVLEISLRKLNRFDQIKTNSLNKELV